MEETPVSREDRGRRLIRHGMALFVLGLLTGILIPVLTSPRLGLAAHVEALLNGIFLILVGGVVWRELRLPERLAASGFWLLLIAAYFNWAFCLLAAVFGASQTLAIAGAGHTAAPWQEQLVSMGLGLGAICVLLACCFVFYGLRTARDPEPGEA
jgi:hydroxylaminobenzene mutase